MQTELLIYKLYKIATNSLSSANQHNPFISKADAMRDINRIRQIDRQLYYYSNIPASK